MVTTERTANDSPDPQLAKLVEASGHPDPSDISLPDGDDATKAWLNGDGAPVVAILAASQPLWKEGRTACASVAKSLDDVGTPTDVMSAASATPEAATRDILVELHATLGRLLATCNDEQAFAAALADFAWQWALADRRLTDLGVER